MDDSKKGIKEKEGPGERDSASDTFYRTMRGMISQSDVVLIQSYQNEALAKFDKTNEKFDQFNRLSAERYSKLYHHFHNHNRMLIDMKKDLDIVFRRIRNLKIKLSKQYGDAFKVTAKNIHQLEEEFESQPEQGKSEEKPKIEPNNMTSSNSEDQSKDTFNTEPQQNRETLDTFNTDSKGCKDKSMDTFDTEPQQNRETLDTFNTDSKGCEDKSKEMITTEAQISDQLQDEPSTEPQQCEGQLKDTLNTNECSNVETTLDETEKTEVGTISSNKTSDSKDDM